MPSFTYNLLAIYNDIETQNQPQRFQENKSLSERNLAQKLFPHLLGQSSQYSLCPILTAMSTRTLTF